MKPWKVKKSQPQCKLRDTVTGKPSRSKKVNTRITSAQECLAVEGQSGSVNMP